MDAGVSPDMSGVGKVNTLDHRGETLNCEAGTPETGPKCPVPASPLGSETELTEQSGRRRYHRSRRETDILSVGGGGEKICLH